MTITNNQRTFVHKTINEFRDVHGRRFKNIRWLRQQLSKVLTKQMINNIISQYRL